MINSKSLTIVTISTILFGMLSKWLVGIPYMSLKHFDLYFVISFILWAIYSTSLYVASKIKCNGSNNFIKISCQGFIFGIIASCLKIGIDSLVLLMVEKTNNQILLTFAMEIVILLFGSLMIFALMKLQKNKFTWDKSLKKVTIILGCLIGVYIITFFSLNSKYQTLTQYTDVNALAKSGNINLNTLMEMENIMQYSKTFTMLSVIVFVVFFIGLWFMLHNTTSNAERID